MSIVDILDRKKQADDEFKKMVASACWVKTVSLSGIEKCPPYYVLFESDEYFKYSLCSLYVQTKDRAVIRLYDNKMHIQINPEFLEFMSTVENAKYGDLEKRSTEQNDTVRSGKVFNGPFPVCFQIWELEQRIRSKLNVDVKLVPHSIMMYGEGDHFVNHVDTPRNDPARMIGTVVVILSDCEEGGDLIIQGENVTKDHKNNQYKVFFFFGDAVHRVEPVKKGVRISLSYDVYATESPIYEQSFTPDQRTNLDCMLQNIGSQPVGILLESSYTVQAVREEVMKSSNDRKLLDYVKKCGIPYKLFICILINEYTGGFPRNPVDDDYEYGPSDLDKVRKSFVDYSGEVDDDDGSNRLSSAIKLYAQTVDGESVKISKMIVIGNPTPEGLMIEDEKTYFKNDFYLGNNYCEGIEIVGCRTYQRILLVVG